MVKIPVRRTHLIRALEIIYRQRENFDQPRMEKEITPWGRIVS